MRRNAGLIMKILAIDFSSTQRTVAALDSGREFEVLETNPRLTNPIGMIEQALQGASLEREEIECVAVGLGPGSYTGIRAAIALAQGWQLARSVKLIGISSAKAVAVQAQRDGITGLVNVVIDAQRGEFYRAVYEIDADSCREMAPLRIVSLAELRTLEQAGGILIGPDVTRWFADSKSVFPRAATLAQLAMNEENFVSGEKLEPIYLRETTFVKAPPSRVVSEIP